MVRTIHTMVYTVGLVFNILNLLEAAADNNTSAVSGWLCATLLAGVILARGLIEKE